MALPPHQVLLQFGHGLFQNAVVVLLETDQLGKTGDEEPCRRKQTPGLRGSSWTCPGAACGRPTVHGVLLSRQQPDQSPEGVFLVHVDEQQGCDLTHSLAVAHLLQQQPDSELRSRTSRTRRNSPCCRWSRPPGRGRAPAVCKGRAMEDSSSETDVPEPIRVWVD